MLNETFGSDGSLLKLLLPQSFINNRLLMELSKGSLRKLLRVSFNLSKNLMKLYRRPLMTLFQS